MIYVEGGGNTKGLQGRCREAFSKLLTECGYPAGAFKIVACGPRSEAFKRFRLRFDNGPKGAYMWIDSEEPVAEVEKTWKHLASRDPSWQRPPETTDEQVLFMTTCMETLIAADRAALKQHFGSSFKENKLPPLPNIEARDRHKVLKQLQDASAGKYEKGDVSFKILAKLNPDTLQKHLPSFARARRILDTVLPKMPHPFEN